MAERVHLVAWFSIRKESVDDFVALMRKELIAPTRREPGCIRYDLCQDLEDASKLALVEEWESDAALQAHLGQPHVGTTVEKLRPMADGPLEVRRLRLVA